MADRGEVDILAVVHNTGYPKAIGAVSVINHYYGRDDILLGAFKHLLRDRFNEPPMTGVV